MPGSRYKRKQAETTDKKGVSAFLFFFTKVRQLAKNTENIQVKLIEPNNRVTNQNLILPFKR